MSHAIRDGDMSEVRLGSKSLWRDRYGTLLDHYKMIVRHSALVAIKHLVDIEYTIGLRIVPISVIKGAISDSCYTSRNSHLLEIAALQKSILTNRTYTTRNGYRL